MSAAAFALQPSGPPAPCGYPKCTLEAFHDGDHLLAKKPDNRVEFPGPRYGFCLVCQRNFKVFGDHDHPMPRTCGSQQCALELCRRESKPVSVLCPCRQRPFPHDLSIHQLLRRESYNPQRRFTYPWSLCLSERREMSTED